MAMSNVPPAPGRQALHEEQRSTPTVLWHGFPENVVMTVLQHLVLQASHCRLFVLQPPQVSKEQSVVVTGPFINFLLHKRAKPILPPWARELKTLTLRANSNPLPPPKARGFIKPLVLPIRPYFKNLSLKKYFLMYYININVTVDSTR